VRLWVPKACVTWPDAPLAADRWPPAPAPARAWDDLRLVGVKLIFLIVIRAMSLLGFVAAGVVVEGRRDSYAAPSTGCG
jgi:hypothetical protein